MAYKGSSQEGQEKDRLLAIKVERLTDSIEYLMSSLDVHMQTLIDSNVGKLPPGCVPLDTHKQVVRGLIVAFTIILFAAIGAVNLIPYLRGVL